MANHEHITHKKSLAAVSASAAVAATPPATILDLGHHLATLRVAHNAHDEASLVTQGRTAQVHHRAMILLEDRADALRALIGTMPAQTIADVAVQIDTAVSVVESLDLISGDDKEEITQIGRTVSLMLRGMLPVVAKAANLDIATMKWGDGERLRISYYSGVGVVA